MPLQGALLGTGGSLLLTKDYGKSLKKGFQDKSQGGGGGGHDQIYIIITEYACVHVHEL